MNSYLFLRRIRGPVMIVVFGITALLNQWGILSFGESWPLYLIVLGALKLMERAAWAQQVPAAYAGQTPPYAVPGQPAYEQKRGGWTGYDPLAAAAPPPPEDEGRK